MTLARFKPAVPKCWLFAVSGMMWSAVGLMLGITAIGWLIPEGWLKGMGYAMAGLIPTLIVLRQRFSRMARTNIHRLQKLPARGCFFAFQAWKSYLIIAFMIILGGTLRHLPIQRPLSGCRLHGHRRSAFSGKFSLLCPLAAVGPHCPPATPPPKPSKIEAILKIGFRFKIKAEPRFEPQAPRKEVPLGCICLIC